MSESLIRLHFLLLLLLCCVAPSSFLNLNDPVVGLVSCRPDKIEAFTKFKSEFDTRSCNHSDDFNGIWCDNSTGAVKRLQLRSCLSGTLKPNSSLFGFHHLTHLYLQKNNFASSSLPSEIGNLNRLELLVLSSNGFIGQVPSSISNLTNLSILDLSQNELIGSFPLIRNLTNLLALELSRNHLTGTIPSSIFNMPFLVFLNLKGNHLTGHIEFPNSTTSPSLKFLNLGLNHFEGQILEPISKLINLERLDLSSQNFSYPIDLRLFSSLSSLMDLSISGNSLLPISISSDSNITTTLETLDMSSCYTTQFPNFLKTLNNLRVLSISYNRIKGQVPKWLWNLPKLHIVVIGHNFFNDFEGSGEFLVNSSVKIFDLSFNRFKRAFPIPPLSINTLYARNNSFTGDIPLSFCNRTSLTVLDLSYNNFTGPVLPCLNDFMVVKLRKNTLEGNLPDMFNAEASLRTLDVGYNRLTGKLPKSFVNCSSLKFLSVDHNRIVDTFPFWLKPLPNVQVLRLSSNHFYGPISLPDQSPLAFPKLRIFEISNNNFTGSLPASYFVDWNASSLTRAEDGLMYMGEKVGDSLYDDFIDLEYKGVSMEQMGIFTSYSAIDFSGNRLEGEIPESIGLLKTLIALNLSNNAFTGHIPLSLANVKELESLDLSRNQLSGTIPNELKTLSFLAYINVSHNQLKGEIPQGPQITGQAKSSFEGNEGLCGLPLETCFSSTSAPPLQKKKQEDEEDKEEIFNWKALAIGYAPGVLFGLVIAQAIASYKPELLVKIIGSSAFDL